MQYKYTDTNKEHLHTLDGKPLTGTSSVVDVLSKPLSFWAVGKALETLGWTKIQDFYSKLPPEITERAKELGLEFKKSYQGKVSVPSQIREENANKSLNAIKELSAKEYLAKLDVAYYAHKKSTDDSATKGTDLHAALEEWVKGEMTGKPIKPIDQIKPFTDWVKTNVSEFLWSEAHCYSERMWVGGISDFGLRTKDGLVAVVDFKSSKDAYVGQFIQAAGYSIQIEENGLWTSDGVKIRDVKDKFNALIVVPFGAKEIRPYIVRDMDGYKKGFESALYLYRLINNHTGALPIL